MRNICKKNRRISYRICSLALGVQLTVSALWGVEGVSHNSLMVVQAEENTVESVTEEAFENETTVEAATVEETSNGAGIVSEKPKPSYINAKAAVLIDAETGQVLFEQNAEEGLPPASTTKVMTALLTIEAIEDGQITLDQKITVDHYARHITPVGGSTMALPVDDNEIVTVEDLLYAVLLKSDCVCCNILAEVVSGSVEEFVEAMNQRAKDLGCENTVFLNSHGFKENGHVMSAHDLALIGAEAMQHKMFYEIVNTAEYTIPPTNLNKSRTLTNTNWLLGTMTEKNVATYGQNYEYEYAHGVKTGFTDEAGHCLVSYAEKDGRKQVCAILGATIETNEATGYPENYMYSESIRLYQWGFAAMENGEVIPDDSVLKDVKDEKRLAAARIVAEEFSQKNGETISHMQQTLQSTWEQIQVERKKADTFTMPNVMKMILIVAAIIVGLVILFFVIRFVRRNFYFDFRR